MKKDENLQMQSRKFQLKKCSSYEQKEINSSSL